MRAAGCFDVDAVFYSGERYARAASFNTDTRGVARRIPLLGVDELLDEVAPGMQVVCVELVEGATSLPEFAHPDNAYYLFGPEDGTLDQSVIDRADAVVFIPTVGCLNLAATVNVVLYDRLAKAPSNKVDDELIRESRDCNNRVVVKSQPSRV